MKFLKGLLIGAGVFLLTIAVFPVILAWAGNLIEWVINR